MDVCLQIFNSDDYIYNFTVHNNIVYYTKNNYLVSFNPNSGELKKFATHISNRENQIDITLMNGLLYSFNRNSDLGVWNLNGNLVKWIKNPMSKNEHDYYHSFHDSMQEFKNYIFEYNGKTYILWSGSRIYYKPIDEEYINVLKCHDSEILCTIFHEGFIYAGGNDHMIRIWKINGICVNILEGHKNDVCHLIIHNNLLYSGSADKNIKIWNLKGQCIRTINVGAYVGCLFIHDNLLYANSNSDIKTWTLNGDLVKIIPTGEECTESFDNDEEFIYTRHQNSIQKWSKYYYRHYSYLPKCKMKIVKKWRKFDFEYETDIHKDIYFLIERELATN